MMSKKSEATSLRSMSSKMLVLNTDPKKSGSFSSDLDGPTSLRHMKEMTENDTPKQKKKKKRRRKRSSAQVSIAGNKHTARTAKYILTHMHHNHHQEKICSLMPPFPMATCNCLVRCYLRFLSSQSLTAYSVSEESGQAIEWRVSDG